MSYWPIGPSTGRNHNDMYIVYKYNVYCIVLLLARWRADTSVWGLPSLIRTCIICKELKLIKFPVLVFNIGTYRVGRKNVVVCFIRVFWLIRIRDAVHFQLFNEKRIYY